MQDLKIGLIAMNSGPDLAENWSFFQRSLIGFAKRGCDIIVGPEMFLGFGDAKRNQQAFDFFETTALPFMKEFSEKYAVHILPGTVPVPDGSHFLNRAYVIGKEGLVQRTYDKRFLFQLDAQIEKPVYDETKLYKSGSQIVNFDLDGWNVGLAICYDLRFPSHFNGILLQGGLPDILLIPSAFTYQTGSAHWEILLRARAIEYQCYVVAPNQVGEHGGGKKSFGHSMVIGPWGEVMLDTKEHLGSYQVTISKQAIADCRARLPSGSTLLQSLIDHR